VMLSNLHLFRETRAVESTPALAPENGLLGTSEMKTRRN